MPEVYGSLRIYSRSADEITPECPFASFIKQKQNIDVDPDSIYDVQPAAWLKQASRWMPLGHLEIYADQKGRSQAPDHCHFEERLRQHITRQKRHSSDPILAELINNDPEVSPYSKVVMIKNQYCHRDDHSNVIFPNRSLWLLKKLPAPAIWSSMCCWNGAVTLGTNDGANVEIRDLVGNDSIYTFGRSSDEVTKLYETAGYFSAKEYYEKYPRSKRNGRLYQRQNRVWRFYDAKCWRTCRITWSIKTGFMTLLDLEAYIEEKEMLGDYENRAGWSAILVTRQRAGSSSESYDSTQSWYLHSVRTKYNRRGNAFILPNKEKIKW